MVEIALHYVTLISFLRVSLLKHINIDYYKSSKHTPRGGKRLEQGIYVTNIPQIYSRNTQKSRQHPSIAV